MNTPATFADLSGYLSAALRLLAVVAGGLALVIAALA